MSDETTATNSPLPEANAFARHVLSGLGARPRALSSVWLYDDEGSRLFRRIMDLGAYYPTRAEREILARHAGDVIERVGARSMSILDLGAGDASKTSLVLRAARQRGVETVYAPIDVSAGALASAESAIAAALPGQRVVPLHGDYVAGLRGSASRGVPGPRLALLLGSNLGNLEHDAAAGLLRTFRDALGAGDHLLVGYDLAKDPVRLRAAYDDVEGVTSAFNLNLLTRINRELGGDFDVRRFRHVATYDPRRPAMESWIVSLEKQRVRVAGRTFEFEAWEAIHTEISCKYRDDHLARFAHEAGLEEVARYHDEAHDFADVLYRVPRAVAGPS